MSLLAGQQLEIAYAGEVVSWYGRTYVRDAAGNVLTQKTELSNRPLVYSSFEDQTVYVDFTDGLLYSYTLTFTVTANPNAPTISAVADQTIDEDTSTGTISFTVGDGQTDPDSLLVTVTSLNPEIIPSSNILLGGSGANRTVTIIPAANQTGTARIGISVSDGSFTVFERFRVTVTPVNDAPTVQGMTVDATEDISRTFTLAGADADGDPLVYTVVTGPTHGSLDVTGATAVYTPDLDYNGPDSFTFRASDGQAESAIASVALTVAAVNDLPWVVSLPVLSTDEDTSASGSLTAGDVEGDAVTFALHTGPQHGTAVVEADGTFVYTPDADFHGTDSFTVQAGDAGGWGLPATVTIDVAPVADAPTATPQTVATVEDTAVTITLAGTDADGTVPTVFTVVGLALRGRLFDGTTTSAPEITAAGYTLTGSQVTYLPDPDFQSEDGFAFVANDGEQDSPADFVTVTIAAVNDAPVAADLALTTTEDTPVLAAVPVTDTEGDALTFVLVDGVSHGRLEFHADGSFLYTPDPGYHGPDAFRVAVADDTAAGNQATITIDVQTVNQAPEAAPDWYTVNRNGTLTVPGPGVLGNDADPEGESLQAVLARGPAHGALTLNPDGSFTYRPASGYTGPDSFAYRARDGVLDSAPTVVSVYVLLSDIQLLSAVGKGDGTVELTYDISTADIPLTGFDLGFYRSVDARYGNGDDVPLGGLLHLSDPADLTPGLHSKTLTIGTGAGQVVLPGAGAAEVDTDYHLLAVADPRNLLVENDGLLYFVDNTAVLTGAYLGTGGTLFVHGG
ncbi:MAG: Ig-like domain-containing protein [Gemmataceae bacterium]